MARKTVKAGAVRASKRKKARRTPSKKRSDIEQIVESWLKEDGLQYRAQHPVGRCHPDIVLNTDTPQPTIVELNGCYWHGHSACATKPLTTRQKRARVKDAKRYHYFLARGYKVMILWGCEIHNDPGGARQKLRDAGRKVK